MRTTENSIDDAIRAHLKENAPEQLITGWVVLVATSSFDHASEEVSGVHAIYPGGSMPWPMALGIVEMGRLRLHAAFSDGEDG
ncbi:MAG TPA: hypothetical protein VIP06_02985 [Nocardioides sp.]